MMTGSVSELDLKRSRVRAVLSAAEADGVWLTSPGAVSWYLCGARVQTSLAGPPVAAVFIGADHDVVTVPANEVDRLRAEELPAGIDVRTVAWHEPLTWQSSGDIRTEESLAAELRAARATLLPVERDRFGTLGADAARVLSRVLPNADPSMSEQELAARVAADIVREGADPLVVMVAGRSRVGVRHPLPTRALLGDRAMIVVCARRQGLIANLTRWVRFEAADPHEAARTSAILEVEAAFLRATRAGTTLADVLSRGAAAYATHGLAADEWTRHHQGGAAGYAGRDPRATPATTDVVRDGQAFAWNPSAPGAKVEDTVIVDGDKVTVVTVDPAWPTVVVDGLARPAELQL